MNGGSWLILFGLAAIWWCMRGRTSGAVGRSVSVRGHTHGAVKDTAATRRFIAEHEGGHAVSAKPLGGKVRSARMTNNSGVVQVRFYAGDTAASVHQVVAFLYAGQIAVGSRDGAWADEADIKSELRRLPRREREPARRKAYADARRIVASRSGEIDRFATKLERKGRV